MIPEPQIAWTRLRKRERLLEAEFVVRLQLIEPVTIPFRRVHSRETIRHDHVPRRDSARSLRSAYLEVVSRQSDGLAVHVEVDGAPVGVGGERNVVLEGDGRGGGEFVGVGDERLIFGVVREQHRYAGEPRRGRFNGLRTFRIAVVGECIAGQLGVCVRLCIAREQGRRDKRDLSECGPARRAAFPDFHRLRAVVHFYAPFFFYLS